MEIDLKSASNVNLKSSQFSPYVSQMLFGSGSSGSLTPSGAMNLWSQSDSVYTAVDLIAGPFSQMEYSLKDKKTGEYLTGSNSHPFLDLLANPGYFMDSGELMYSLMVSFLVTGMALPKAIGNVKFEPAELRQVYSSKVNLIPDGNNYLYQMTFANGEDSNIYTRQLIPKRKTAVYQAGNNMAETMPILKSKQSNNMRASSPLERVVYQVYSKYYGNIHNTNLLKNGSKPGGLWAPGDGPMSQDQYEAFKSEIQDKFTGPENAGRNIIAPRPVNYESFMLKPSDMDFVNLLEASATDIYNLYHIPLALVSAKTMTMSNFENSQTALYDEAVLPNAYLILKRLGEFLLPRYKDGDRFELTFDEKTLPALRARMIDQAKKMREVGSFSEDEIRMSTGYSTRTGGDTVWKPSTLIPEDMEGPDDLTGGDDEGEELEIEE